MSKYELKINTGFVKVPVLDEDGEELGFIRFNPTDADIVKRYKSVVEYFKSLEGLDDNMDINGISLVSDEIKSKLDYLFNSNVSDTLFSRCSPLSPMEDGELFLFHVLDPIKDLMNQIMDERMEKMRKVEEATKDYE